LHILVVEDNQADFVLLKELLDPGHSLTWHLYQAYSLAQAFAMCNDQDFDIILLDLGLPDSRGLETFLSMNGQVPFKPIVILSGQDDDTLALEAVHYGAQDYIQKGQFDKNLLYRAINYAIERKRLEVEIKEREEKYRFLTENMVDVIWQVSISESIKMQYISPSVQNLLGYSPAEFARIPLKEVMTKDSWDTIQTTWHELISEQRPQGEVCICIDIEHIAQDGTHVWAEVRARTLLDGQGRLIGAYGVTRDISERKDMEQKLQEMSFHDHLTGLYSRRFFEQELQRFQDGRHVPLGLIICDIDNLKMVNDHLGHDTGDELICRAAGILQSSLRQSDIVARIGGDEFAVLLPNTSQEAMARVCERITLSCPARLLPGSTLPVSLSIGYAVAETMPVDTRRLNQLADEAMYQDKKKKGWSRCGSSRTGKFSAVG
jgi:diguanylate cyclase (GGDEF)-like protein/PAS domain S-box-containing protein